MPRCQARNCRRRMRGSSFTICSLDEHGEIADRMFAHRPGWARRMQIAMRPDILNPLFTEIEALKGVGPTLAKPLERLGLARAVDVAFHLPVSFVDRRMVDELMLGDSGRVIGITLRSEEHTSELQSLMRNSYAVFCLQKKQKKINKSTCT